MVLSDALIALAQTAYLSGLELSKNLAALYSYGPREETGWDLHLPHKSAARAAREIVWCLFVSETGDFSFQS